MSLSALLAPDRDLDPTPPPQAPQAPVPAHSHPPLFPPSPPSYSPPPAPSNLGNLSPPRSPSPRPIGMELLCRAAAAVAGPEWTRRGILKRPLTKRSRPKTKRPSGKQQASGGSVTGAAKKRSARKGRRAELGVGMPVLSAVAKGGEGEGDAWVR